SFCSPSTTHIYIPTLHAALPISYTPVINVTGGTFSDPSALKYMKANANVNIKLTADKTCPGFKTTSGQTLTMDLGGKILTLADPDRKSTRLNSSHVSISYAVFCL